MLASLPMYDLPGAQPANDRLWAGIRAALGHGPKRLTRGGDPWVHWLAPDLLLSQCCGYPYRARLHGRVTLVGTPDHGLPGCPPGHYHSVFVARLGDPRTRPEDFAGARLAFNDPLSQSGWAAPLIHASRHGFAFGAAIRTGAHLGSARAVAEGRAEIAALDAVSWAMIRRDEPLAAALREVGRTAPSPALPYVTAAGRDPAPLFEAITRAIAGLPARDRATLSLKGLVEMPAEAYLAQPDPPPPGEGVPGSGRRSRCRP